jgi:hypothetical protein
MGRDARAQSTPSQRLECSYSEKKNEYETNPIPIQGINNITSSGTTTPKSLRSISDLRSHYLSHYLSLVYISVMLTTAIQSTSDDK